jgi:hypothetical protein
MKEILVMIIECYRQQWKVKKEKLDSLVYRPSVKM